MYIFTAEYGRIDFVKNLLLTFEISYLRFPCVSFLSLSLSEISNCEADIAFFAGRHDEDTRLWLINDFHNWFSDPGDSRAYVLLGDAGVGKSVMSGALAQRAKKAEHLGAAYFCRHSDGTRNDPRYLLGTVACQLCACNSQYSNVVGGEGGVRMMLANSKLGVLELFTKLLHEPLGKCNPCEQRKLVIIDALDETDYESREDFLDLLMHRFPLLPKWLVFFITSRPEDTVQFRLKKYNPCVKICTGNSENVTFYQQHEQDIKRYLEKRVDFSHIPYSVEDITKKCSGLFLYAYFIVEVLNDPLRSGKIGQLSDVFPGDIDDFFRENFQRIFDKVGADLYRKLFSCVVAAPSPLPLSFISFILKKENSDLDEQEVVDAVSQFVVMQTSDQTLTFLHSLIPSWLTDRKKASRRLFISKIKADEYFRDIVLEFLPAVVNDQSKKLSFIESDLLDYMFRIIVRVLCGDDENESLMTVFRILTSYQFLQKRIQNSRIGIYSVVGDFKLAARCQALGEAETETLQEICAVLENNVYVLVECPHLLPSCLRNASKDVQRMFAIPDGVSAIGKKFNYVLNPVCEVLNNMECFALSPDKKLLAGSKGGSIYLFDACSLKRLLGPVEVLEITVRHLKFSPDGKFVFFGRLDRWLCVERGCVQEFSPFSGNSRIYSWIVFTEDDHLIAARRIRDNGGHNIVCFVNAFCMWAVQELDLVQDDETICSCRFPEDDHNPLKFQTYSTRLHSWVDPKRGHILASVRDLLSVLKRKRFHDWCSLVEKLSLCIGQKLCDDCNEFDHKYQQPTLALACQRIVDLYGDMFPHQVWNLRSGKAVLEEVFSAGFQLNQCFYLCHITSLEHCEALFCDVDKHSSLCNIALINAVSFMFRDRSLATISHNSSLRFSSFFFKTVPAEFYNHLTLYRRQSLDGKWIAAWGTPFQELQGYNQGFHAVKSFKITTQHHQLFNFTAPDHIIRGATWSTALRALGFNNQEINKVNLFKIGTHHHDIFDFTEPDHIIRGAEEFEFTYSSDAVVYRKCDNSFHVFCLRTGTVFSSFSGYWPFYDVLEDQIGFVFRAKHDEKNVFVCDFPIGLLRGFINPSNKVVQGQPLGVTFTLAGDILSLWSNLMLTAWKTEDDGSVTAMKESSMKDTSKQVSRVSPVEKCAFSRDGSLIATLRGTEILLYHRNVFLCSVFEESVEEKCNVSCLTFSADDTLLLYCVEKNNCLAHLYLWDVKKREVSSFVVPELWSINCCCLSSDNSRLIICGELYVEIFELVNSSCRLVKKMELDPPYNEFERCTHCTISTGNELLACCIADNIELYPLGNSAGQSFRQLPPGHLGRIEFCQFLKGTRYLISYGVDGALFLWDLCEWKAVAFARIAQGRENILSIGVSPEEDKVVCLTSSGQLSMIKLCGLKLGKIPSEFPSLGVAGGQGLTRETSRRQPHEQPAAVSQM